MADTNNINSMEAPKRVRPSGVKYPSKTSINLLITESHAKEHTTFAVVIVIAIIAAIAFSYFGLFRPMVEINALQSAYNDKQSELETLTAQTADFDEVQKEYSHYGNNYLNDEEKAEQDRLSILKVVENELMTSGALENISITGNTATLTINNDKLKNVSEIIRKLESYDIVDYASVSTSQTDNQEDSGQTASSQKVLSTMTINFKDANADETDSSGDESSETTDTTTDGEGAAQ